MKMKKTAIAVLMLAAGLTSGAALAGQAVTWGPNESGKELPVVWKVYQPADFNFTMIPADITSVGTSGEANGAGGIIGIWQNGPKNPAYMKLSDIPDFTGASKNHKVIQAQGYTSNTANKNEYMMVTMTSSDGTTPLDLKAAYTGTTYQFTPGEAGKLTGKLVKADGDTALTDIAKLVSDSFKAKITVQINQQ